MNQLEHNLQVLAYIDSQGRSGKTFLLNTIIVETNIQRIATIEVSSSGISTLLLLGGMTAQSVLEIPLDSCRETSFICFPSDEKGIILQEIELIIWDELNLQHCYSIKAIY
ncbi:hypothetical protein O181_023300 [Austropuccinia psidii MF-1]|uniref:ATP-dependent DNA helicase n=1 Tax=Austropuccinia psidii MF-1 TaxID=1389203 RepID=A0A9Q3CIW3_9BASI|nr:hypothetical protein [Austropuccinia psidii MF-1]